MFKERSGRGDFFPGLLNISSCPKNCWGTADLRIGSQEIMVKHSAVQGKKKGGDGKSEIRFVI